MAGLPVLLRYLGFDLLVKPGTGLAIQARKQGPGWAHFSATMSAGSNARPIPQYGSLTHGNYDVVCFWGRPGMDAVCSRLEQLKTIQHGRAIVIYFGPVSKAQRRDLATATRQRGLEPVLLDETLLLFLSRCTEVRLGDFLRCSLPYATLNPYMPFVAGDVPAEMYFGRDEMAKEIESIEGSCLVYGGRQLGKSALLGMYSDASTIRRGGSTRSLSRFSSSATQIPLPRTSGGGCTSRSARSGSSPGATATPGSCRIASRRPSMRTSPVASLSCSMRRTSSWMTTAGPTSPS